MAALLIEFPADDPNRALRFWREVLGTDLQPRPAGAGAGWESQEDGLCLGVHQRGQGPGDTGSLAYFTVDDMESAVERVRKSGGSVIHPGERWSICRDSEGSAFALATRLTP
jgi:predicted enzyme related to lactoylglutathione lyase